jgi:hypothetical protein
MNTEEIVIYATLVVIGANLLVRSYRKYKVVMADGKITMEEAIDVAEELTEIILSITQIKKMRKAELIAFCKENDLETDGTKPILLSRIEDFYEKED